MSGKLNSAALLSGKYFLGKTCFRRAAFTSICLRSFASSVLILGVMPSKHLPSLVPATVEDALSLEGEGAGDLKDVSDTSIVRLYDCALTEEKELARLRTGRMLGACNCVSPVKLIGCSLFILLEFLMAFGPLTTLRACFRAGGYWIPY